MARRSTTYNRTNKNTETPSARKQRREAREAGRGRNQAYTSGARAVNYRDDNRAANVKAWSLNKSGRDSKGRFSKTENAGKIDVYTRSATGKMSANGNTAGGSTWAFTERDDNGNLVRQSGRNKIANRNTRYQETRRSFNNNKNAFEKMGGYEGLRARGLTDEEIERIYGQGGQGLSVT